MSPIRNRALSAFCFFSLATSAIASEWPQWRGPTRDAVSTEVGLLKVWPKDGPQLHWYAKEIGAGYSTPAIAGAPVFLSNEGIDKEFVRAISIVDGKDLWSVHIGRVGNPNQRPSYPAARTTPTIDGDLLYALGSDGDLVCLQSASGALKWKKNLRKDFDGKPGEWAYSDSPLIDGDRLIVTPGGEKATVVALNKKTGDVLWQTATPEADAAGYASAIVIELDGVRQYLQFLAKGLVSFDASTGKILWRYDGTGKGPANMTTPIVHGNLIYTGGGLSGGGAIKVTKGAAGVWKTEQLYFNKNLPQSSGGVVRVGEEFYGSTQAGLACVDFKTGQVKWQDKSVGPASICVADGRLYLHAESGEVALVEPSAAGYRELARFTPAGMGARGKDKAWAHPVIADGKLYIRDGAGIWCYAVK